MPVKAIERNSELEALLIVDYQQGFVSKTQKDIQTKIENLAETFRGSEFPVILTKFINHQDTAFNKILHWDGMTSTKEQKLALKLSQNDKIITKDTYSALTAKLQEYLKEKQIDTIYLCGIDTDACIIATAFALFDAGYKTCVVEDACTTPATENSMQNHFAALQIIARSLGNMTTTENVLRIFDNKKKKQSH